MLASVPFLIATILVYVCVRELRNTHGFILICYLATLAVAYSTLSFTQLYNGVFGKSIDQPTCAVIAHTTYFALLSTFFWTNVLSFHLWVGLRYNSQCFFFLNSIHQQLWFINIVRSAKNRIQDISRKWLIGFMIYGWGAAAILTGLVLYLRYNDAIPEEYRPRIGITTCFIDGKSNDTLEEEKKNFFNWYSIHFVNR